MSGRKGRARRSGISPGQSGESHCFAREDKKVRWRQSGFSGQVLPGCIHAQHFFYPRISSPGCEHCSRHSGRRIAQAPIRLVVFPFELEDFSAAAAYIPPDEIDREQLRLSTEEARRLIAASDAISWSTSARSMTRRRRPENYTIATDAKPRSPPAFMPTNP